MCWWFQIDLRLLYSWYMFRIVQEFSAVEATNQTYHGPGGDMHRNSHAKQYPNVGMMGSIGCSHPGVIPQAKPRTVAQKKHQFQEPPAGGWSAKLQSVWKIMWNRSLSICAIICYHYCILLFIFVDMYVLICVHILLVCLCVSICVHLVDMCKYV